MGEGLSVSYQSDTDGTGQLTVRASANGFSGNGAAWFHEGELLEFASQLTAEYPFPVERSVSLRGGYWADARPRFLEYVHVGLEFLAVDTLGHIMCLVELAAPRFGALGPEEESRVKLALFTTYEPLRRFGESLSAVVRGQVAEACLEAHGA